MDLGERWTADLGGPRVMPGEVERSRAWEEFLPLWSRLVDATNSDGWIVVVEGVRDVRSLRRLGVRGTIVAVHHGRTLSELAHELARHDRPVIILTDWDTEGGHLARRIREFLEASGGRFDLDYRRRLARVVRGEVVHVEGLAGWAHRTAERNGATFDEAIARTNGDPFGPDGPTG